MSGSQLGLALIGLGILGLVGLVVKRARSGVGRVAAIPARGPLPPAAIEPLAPTEHEQIIQVLRNMDRNAADRMIDLKVFLFFLPFIWGIIWGIVYVIYSAVR